MPTKTPPQSAKIYAAIDKLYGPVERQILRSYRAALDETRGYLGKLYEKYAKEGVLTHAEMSKYNRLQSLHAQLTDMLGPEFSRDGRLIGRLTRVVYEETFYRMGWMLTETAGVSGKWGLLPPDLVKAAIEKPYSGLSLPEVWTRARAGALSDIERAVVQGLVQGDSYPHMAARVKAAFDTNAKRALLIAQTEGHRAQVEGQKTAYDRAAKMGIEVKQVWDATLDGRTRESHQEMDGREAEDHGGRPMFYMRSIGAWVGGPGLTGVAAEDINCRCRITPVIKGYEPTERRIQGALGAYQTYDEWAKYQGMK